jgi:hypothetical protein
LDDLSSLIFCLGTAQEATKARGKRYTNFAIHADRQASRKSFESDVFFLVKIFCEFVLKTTQGLIGNFVVSVFTNKLRVFSQKPIFLMPKSLEKGQGFDWQEFS